MEQTAEEPQRGGLAGAVRPKEAEDFAGPDPQIQVVNRNDAGRISLGKAVSFHGQGLRHGMPSSDHRSRAIDPFAGPVHTQLMREGRIGGPRRRLSELLWALPRLSRAGNGRALGVLSIWIAWNHILEWIWRPRSVRAGGILRYRLAHHWGHRLELKDGTWVSFGDPVVELHFDNWVLHRMAEASDWSPWATIERFDADLDALAQLVGSGPLSRARALHGVTLFASPGRRLGFELHPVPHTWTWSLQRFYLISLLPIYHRDGWREFDHMRRNRWPVEAWMSIKHLLARSYPRVEGRVGA
jgi:hypothetical protein